MSFADRSRAEVPWLHAWRQANTDFYREQPAEGHFLTSVEMGTQVAQALATVVEQQMSRHAPREFFIIDIGAGSGRLLEQLRSLVTGDVHFIGVDIRERPAQLSTQITWRQMLIDGETSDITGADGELAGVVIAHEFLDDVPCDVVELDEDLTPQVVLVDPQCGTEELGPRLDDPAAIAMLSDQDTMAVQRWLHEWWPATRPGARREVGLARSRVWSMLTRIIDTGVVIAVDYAHGKPDRAAGLWDAGTLKGFAAGRPTRPVPDSSVNITAHVALDALATPRARIASQAELLGGSTLSSWPAGVGSYTWLVEPIDRGTMSR